VRGFFYGAAFDSSREFMTLQMEMLMALTSLIQAKVFPENEVNNSG